jgi:hypothetical protein
MVPLGRGNRDALDGNGERCLLYGVWLAAREFALIVSMSNPSWAQR